jgi:hypothetical protein
MPATACAGGCCQGALGAAGLVRVHYF